MLNCHQPCKIPRNTKPRRWKYCDCRGQNDEPLKLCITLTTNPSECLKGQCTISEEVQNTRLHPHSLGV
ncbi:hypothetical protein chiPu_0010622 [Chiloscyllium punctatum]|uniref:Uncharacterized protein n=1 Tax=Chiloscyllium punctatum TaxID=137246 RepID=A0A401SP42_CHIPU|nr:hypothetical protein [Chiloscyllium punctatum]